MSNRVEIVVQFRSLHGFRSPRDLFLFLFHQISVPFLLFTEHLLPPGRKEGLLHFQLRHYNLLWYKLYASKRRKSARLLEFDNLPKGVKSQTLMFSFLPLPECFKLFLNSSSRIILFIFIHFFNSILVAILPPSPVQ
jgi:hypothetical protein